MSVTGFYNGNVQVPVSQALAGTGVTKIGDTATNDSQTLASVAFCNDNAGTVTCQLRWYDAANAVEHLVWQGPVETKKSVVLRLTAEQASKAFPRVDVEASSDGKTVRAYFQQPSDLWNMRPVLALAYEAETKRKETDGAEESP